MPATVETMDELTLFDLPEPDPEPASGNRAQHNTVMDALAAAVFPGVDQSAITRRQWGWLAKAKADIVTACSGDLDIAAAQIPVRAQRFTSKWLDLSLSATALAKWWHELGTGRKWNTVSDWSGEGGDPATETFRVPEARPTGVSDWGQGR